MFPCGQRHFLYDPYKKYCKINGYVARCDPSMCLSGENEWERQACGLYCGDLYRELETERTVLIWQIVSGVLIVIMIILSVVIGYLCLKNRKKQPTPYPKTSGPDMPKNKDETSVLIPDGSIADSAVGSDISQTTVNRSPPPSILAPPQNNHVDPHTERYDRAGLALTGRTENFQAPCAAETTVP